MDLKREQEYIENFFEELTDKEFMQMLDECGNNLILPTKQIYSGLVKEDFMIKEFCLAWERNKGKLEEYFRTTEQNEYDEYKTLVGLLFDIVINPEFHNKFDTKNILNIDDGDYQWTEIFILHKNVYQPDIKDYVYTNVYYGSCSGCDTLLSINDYRGGLPNDS